MKTGFNDIFISYGRGNENSPGSKSFTIELHKILEEKGFDVWLDHQDIPHAVDFQKEINEGIKSADNFIFIISPHSVTSIFCMQEIELAVELNKRIIPILHIDPEQQVLEDSLHPEIKKLNWIYFNDEEKFETSIKQLEDAIITDQLHLSIHTEYTTQAVNWRENNRNIDLLLRGGALRKAEKWLKEAKIVKKDPAPSDLQEEFISKSRKDSNFRIFRRIAAVIVFILVSSTLSLALYYSQMEKAAAREALLNLQKATSNELIAKASAIQCEESEEAGLKVAALAYEADTTNLMAKTALFDAYYKTFQADAKEKNIKDWSTQTTKNNYGLFAELTGENTVTIYNGNGEKYGSFKSSQNIQAIHFDTSEEIIYAKTDEGESLAYHLNTDWLLKNLENRSVPKLNQTQLRKYGIKEDLNKRLEDKLSDLKSKRTTSQTSNSNNTSTNKSNNQNENEKKNETVTSQQELADNKEEINSKTTNLFESKDRSRLIEAYKNQLQKYLEASEDNKYDEADQLHKIAIYAQQVFPEQNDIQNALLKSTNLLADESFSKNQYDQAIKLASEGLAINPSQKNLEKIRISALLKTNNLTDARKLADPLLDESLTLSNGVSTFRDVLIKEIEEDRQEGEITPAQQRFERLIQFIPLEVQGILINDRSEVTSSPDVSLKIYANGAKQMLISNTPMFNDGANWENFQNIKKWKLQQGQGKRTVYIKFKDAKGNESKGYQQSILLTRY